MSAHLMFTELSSVTKLWPPFRRRIGTSNVAALCPAKTVQTFFVVRFEASVVLAFKKFKNCASASYKGKTVTG